MRREFPSKIKLARWDHAKGCCESCGVTIRGGNGPHYDHVIPDALGGAPTFDNCRCLCRTCHGLKTSDHDVPMIAKGKRIKARHVNAKDKRRGFRGWRKFDGTAVYKERLIKAAALEPL